MTAWHVAHAGAHELAERPVWDDRDGSLHWVDINAGDLHRLSSEGTHSARHVGGPLGAAALRQTGGLVLAHGGEVGFLDADGAPDRAAVALGLAAGVRFNDGACDPAGRFIVGTCSTDGRPERGALYSFRPDGSVEELLTGVTESNGLAWSPDGSAMYYVDSGEPCLREYPYDVATGALGDRRDLVVYGQGDGIPDGLIVDAEGAIWVAMWEGWSVRRIAPDGRELMRIPTPVSRPTCSAFGGPALDRLYLASAWEGMSEAERAAEPLAGAILVTTPAVVGSPALRFAG